MHSRPLLIVTAQPLLHQALAACFSSAESPSEAGDVTPQPRFHVVAPARSVSEAITCLTQQPVAVTVIDLDCPGDAITAAIQSLLAARPNLRILALSSSNDTKLATAALRAGVHGFLSKSVDQEALLAATRRCLTEDLVLEQVLLNKLALRAVGRDGADASPEMAQKLGLDDREYQALSHLARGRSNQEIAAAMYVSIGSVKTYLTGAARKLDVANRVQLLVRACELGLVSPCLNASPAPRGQTV